MIKFAVRKWEENREKLAEELWRDRKDGYTYKELAQKVVSVILNEGEEDKFAADRITQINNGDYQGTLLFLIPEDRYEPEEYEYLMTYVNYGSCGLCDVLEHYNEMEYEEGEGKSRPEDRIKGYLSICRALLCNMIKPYNYGWREEEEFQTVRWEQTEEERALEEKLAAECGIRFGEVKEDEGEEEGDAGLWDRKKWKGISREAGTSPFAQSVKGLLMGGHERDREFQKIVKEALPGREDFVTVSGKKAFSGEYELKVPERPGQGFLGEEGRTTSRKSSPAESSRRKSGPAKIREERALVETAFDYMVRAWLLMKRNDYDARDIEGYLRLHHIPLVVQAREETRAGLELVNAICGKEQGEILREKRRWCLERLFVYFRNDSGEDEKAGKISELMDSCLFLARLKQAGLTGRISQEALLKLFEGRDEGEREKRREISFLVTECMRYFPERTVREKTLILDFEAYTGMGGYTGSLEEGGVFVSGDTLYMCSLAPSPVWRWQEAARLLTFYLLNLCCLAEGAGDGDEGICGARPGGREGYHERIIRKIAICRVRFGEVEVCDLSKLNQERLLKAAKKLARWNGKDIPDKTWESFLLPLGDKKRIYTSNLVKELGELPYAARRGILRVIGETDARCGVYARSWEENARGKRWEWRNLTLGVDGYPGWERGGIKNINIETENLKNLRNSMGGLEGNGVSCERLEGNYEMTRRCVRLDRGELMGILTARLTMGEVFCFKRGEKEYEWSRQGRETEAAEPTQEEREALERLKMQLSLFHSRLQAMEELVIVEGFFEPGEELETVTGQAGETRTEYNLPYMVFRSRRKVVMARECLKEERHTRALMRLFQTLEKLSV